MWNSTKEKENKKADSCIHSRIAVAVLVAQSCLTLCNPTNYSLPGSSVHWDSPGKNTEVDCHSLLQSIFLIWGSNPGLLHCRQILYHLSYREDYFRIVFPKYDYSGWLIKAFWLYKHVMLLLVPYYNLLSLRCNGNPLQCSCLENPRDGRAWWAAVYGVAQSRTRLKRLSSSSSSWHLRWVRRIVMNSSKQEVKGDLQQP